MKTNVLLAAIMLAAAALFWVWFPPAEPAIKATWIWKGDLIVKESAQILSFAKENGINRMYLHIEPNNVPRRAYRSFVREARAAGIDVDALAGEPEWSLVEKREGLEECLQWVTRYNRSVPEEERFTGIHLDVEPHVLPDWRDNKEEIMKQWAENMRYVIREARKEKTLEVSADIPFWLTQFPLDGGNVDISTWLIDQLDHVTLMAYRDKVEGPNGVADIVSRLLQGASHHREKVVVGLNLLPSKEGDATTFHEEGMEALDDQLDILQEVMEEFPPYAGYAIHDYENWSRLTR